MEHDISETKLTIHQKSWLTVSKAEMEPGHGLPGYRVSDFDRVRSGHGSVCHIGV